MKIIQFIGTCSDPSIGTFAQKRGKKVSFEKAKNAIKAFDASMYDSLALDLKTFYEEYTNIKEGTLLGVRGKFLHVIHSAVDFIFQIE